VGDAELLFDQARAFAERARADRVEVELDVYPGMTHVWHAFAAAIPALEPAFGAIGRFVRKHVGAQGAARATRGASI
jgi:acetyl esterase/lipase